MHEMESRAFGKEMRATLDVFPREFNDVNARDKLDLSNRELFKITCGLDKCITFIQLHFRNKENNHEIRTQRFGTIKAKHLMCSLEVPDNETVKAVNVGHNPSSGSISSLTFETDKGTAIEFKGTRPESDPKRSRV